MGSPLSVRYSIIWPCGFYRVVTWRTSPQTVFISFTSPFPEPPASLPASLPTLSGSPSVSASLVFSSSSDKRGKSPTVSPPLTVIDGFLVQKMITYVYHFGVRMEAILLSKGSQLPGKRLSQSCECSVLRPLGQNFFKLGTHVHLDSRV